MEKEKFSYPVSLRRMQITDKFWKNEMELVRCCGSATTRNSAWRPLT